MMSPGISVVVPVYKSAAILPHLLAGLEKVLRGCTERYEVILVCDGGSGEECWELVLDQAKSRPWLRGLALAKNYGQHAATLAGIEAAGYDRIVTMDDDLQHPPESISRLLERLTDGTDVVYAQSTNPMGGPSRAWASRSFRNTLRLLAGVAHFAEITAFRALRTTMRERFAGHGSSVVSVDLLLAGATTKVAFVPVRFDLRKAGRSNYNLRKLTLMALAWFFAANPKILWWLIGLGAGWLVVVTMMLARLQEEIAASPGSAIGRGFWGGMVIGSVVLQLVFLFVISRCLRQRAADSSGPFPTIVQDRINFPAENIG